MDDEYHVHPYRHGASDHNQHAGGVDFVELAKYQREEIDRLRAENERLRGALETIKKITIDCEAREIAEQMLAHGR